MNRQDIELQIPAPKVRSRKNTVFDRPATEEEMCIPENSINNYMAPSASSQPSLSRQTSGNSLCRHIIIMAFHHS